MKYREITDRLKKLGFRFYRQGKGSHELYTEDNGRFDESHSEDIVTL